ncbi:MAG: chemotaxis protein CheX [Deltaproteobacteria bacterium]|nr:chemotaxis protein CheX [Deltaproteobacteria bacterium]
MTFEVLETMYYLFPETLEEGEVVPSKGPYLRSWVAIAGPQSIRIGLLVPQSLARKMAANFLGTGEEEIYQPEMEDILKETTNMMAGAFLSKMEASTAFKLQTPEAQWLTAEEKKKKTPPNRLRFEVDDELMELFVEKG